MNWKSVIEELQAAGFTQTEIAEYVGRSQAWVSSLSLGKGPDVRYSDGAKLLSMRTIQPSHRKAA